MLVIIYFTCCPRSLTSLERFAEEVPPMSATRFIEPVVRFCAVITRHDAARQWAVARSGRPLGHATIRSPEIPFEAGGYYTPSMGSGLQKSLIAVADFTDPGGLADWKNETNQWEQEYTESSQHEEERPLNLDPGYMTQAKLVLATTKDRDHRLYLRDGMFAEVTLTYVGQSMAASPLDLSVLSHRRGREICQSMPSRPEATSQGNKAVSQPPSIEAPS